MVILSRRGFLLSRYTAGMRHPKDGKAGLLIELDDGVATISDPAGRSLHSLGVVDGAWEEMFDAVLASLRSSARPTCAQQPLL